MLWGGFIVKHKTNTLYFAGDTGWGKHFEQIANAFAHISVSLLPIGAYKPQWFMKNNHISPQEALLAHHILQSKLSIAMHFNCFRDLADDSFDEAKNNLIKAIATHPELMVNGDFVMPLPGETF